MDNIVKFIVTRGNNTLHTEWCTTIKNLATHQPRCLFNVRKFVPPSTNIDGEDHLKLYPVMFQDFLCSDIEKSVLLYYLYYENLNVEHLALRYSLSKLLIIFAGFRLIYLRQILHRSRGILPL